MSKFTPSPWKVCRHSHIGGELWLSVLSGAWDITHNEASEPGVVASAKYSAMTNEENEANARLIACAPELLELLKECLECEFPVLNRETISKAETIIAKAEGREG